MLAKADRYYLLVRVLRRLDCLHDWIYARCREVENDPDEHLDIWARDHYKSTIITFAGSIQEILRDPEITIGIFSQTKGTAEKFLSQIKEELEHNQSLIWAFPEIFYANPERETLWSVQKGIIVKRKSNPKEATVEAWGLVDGSPIGAHFGLIIYDDVVVPKSVGTPDQISKTTDAWSMSLNLSTASGRKQYAGTRYHFADTYDVIMTRKAAVPRIHPATDNGRKDGNPVLLTEQQWDNKVKTMLDSTLASQQLCNPLAGSNSMFSVKDLRVYETRPRTLMGYLLCDPARSKKKDSANTAMVVIGIDAQGNKYLLDGFDHKMDLMERWKRFRDLQEKWVAEPGMVGLTCGYEAFGAQSDLDYFHEQQRIEGNHFEIIELYWPRDSEGSKDDRVQRLVPDVKGHKFFMPYETHEEAYTKNQRSMIAAGYDYRVARPIRRLDENGAIYDVTERLRMQFAFYPYTGKKDLIDATSRIYDADPTTPESYENVQLEPEAEWL